MAPKRKPPALQQKRRSQSESHCLDSGQRHRIDHYYRRTHHYRQYVNGQTDCQSST